MEIPLVLDCTILTNLILSSLVSEFLQRIQIHKSRIFFCCGVGGLRGEGGEGGGGWVGGGGGGGGRGSYGRYEHESHYILSTQHIVMTSSTEPYGFRKIIMMVFKTREHCSLNNELKLRKYASKSCHPYMRHIIMTCST